MTVWESLLLGIVQGATEFLPVSSSGHLVLAQTLLGVRVPGVVFEVAVHVATLVSIVLVYRARVAELLRGLFARDEPAVHYALMIVVATVPAAVIGVAFDRRIEALFEAPQVVGVAFLLTGALLWSSRAALARDPEAVHIGLRVAVLIGLAQALALTPGISRSGTTVVAALWLGIRPGEAAAFSFLMAIPAVSGAAVLQIPDLSLSAGELGGPVLVAGTLAAAVTGVLAIRTFVRMLERKTFPAFAVYLWVVGAAFLVYLGTA